MKKLLLIVISLLAVQQLHGQKLELTAHLNSGMFYFAGNGATQNSLIIQNTANNSYNYVNNPYGSKPSLSYGIAGQLQWVSKINIITGLQLGYQHSRSTQGIYENSHTSNTNYVIPATITGNSTLNIHSIAINPYVGYRLLAKKVTIDLDAGFQLGVGFHSHISGQTTVDDGSIDKVSYDLQNHVDPGFSFELKAGYKRYGITGGYSYGELNYLDGLIGGPARYAYSRMIRFGISYRIH